MWICWCTTMPFSNPENYEHPGLPPFAVPSFFAYRSCGLILQMCGFSQYDTNWFGKFRGLNNVGTWGSSALILSSGQLSLQTRVNCIFFLTVIRFLLAATNLLSSLPTFSISFSFVLFSVSMEISSCARTFLGLAACGMHRSLWRCTPPLQEWSEHRAFQCDVFEWQWGNGLRCLQLTWSRHGAGCMDTPLNSLWRTRRSSAERKYSIRWHASHLL